MRLTGRKLEVAKKLWKKDKQIADELGIGVPTVKAYIREILMITNSQTRTEAMLKLLTKGICPMEEVIVCS